VKPVRWLAKLARDVRAATREDGVGVGRIARDLVALNLHNRLGVRAYFQYRLFDRSISSTQQRDYLPDSHWATDRLWALLNPVQYRLPFRNKLRSCGQLGGPGVRRPGAGPPPASFGYSGDSRHRKSICGL
jgi:hypothetical protein